MKRLIKNYNKNNLTKKMIQLAEDTELNFEEEITDEEIDILFDSKFFQDLLIRVDRMTQDGLEGFDFGDVGNFIQAVEPYWNGDYAERELDYYCLDVDIDFEEAANEIFEECFNEEFTANIDEISKQTNIPKEKLLYKENLERISKIANDEKDVSSPEDLEEYYENKYNDKDRFFDY